MIGSRVGGGGRHDDRVLHRAGLLELSDDAGDVGLLLTNRDVNVVDRTEVLNSNILLIDPGLIDHRIHADRGLAGGTITNDQLTLTATNGNHRVDSHDSSLERLAYGLPLDDTRGDLLDRIERCGFDRTLAIERAAEDVHDSTQQSFSDRHR